MLTLGLSLLLATVVPVPPNDGAQLYATYCASCHGARQSGSADGPSLHGVGLASVDFYLGTGRMPAAAPWVEIGHRAEATGGALPLQEIRALETYLAPVVAGGPPIPIVQAGGDVPHGHALYEVHCQACHSVGGVGGDIGESDWAPALDRATLNDIADAVRAGPDQMPRFGEAQLSARDLDDLATYIFGMVQARGPGNGLPFRSTGPVPEGAIGYVAVLSLVVFVFVFWRSDTAPLQREEAVRRDEGERSA